MQRFRHSWMLPCIAMVLVAVWITAAGAVRNDNGKWSILDVGATKPPARKHHTMVYDPVYNRVILFAGETETVNGDAVLNDLWMLDLGGASPQWTRLADGPTLHGHSAAYGSGKMYVVCGLTNFSGTLSSDAHVLNLGATPSWGTSFGLPTSQSPICPGYDMDPFKLRSHSAAAYVNGDLFVMGGRAEFDNVLHDVWAYENDAWGWKSGLTGGGFVQPGQIGACAPGQPDFRYWHTMIDAGGRMVVFGGVYENSVISNTFVSPDGFSWTDLGDAPTTPYNFTRMFHAADYDWVDERMIVVGGYLDRDKMGIMSDVTSLPLPESLDGEWELLSPSGTGPGTIAEHGAVYDSERDRMIVFGGVTANEVLRSNDTYVLEFADQTPPATATLGGGRGTTTAAINWTAPGDDGATGTAAEYDLRQSTSPINAANFSSATPLATSAPQPTGSAECVDLASLTPCQKYYYALKTRDAAGNWSALSNVLSLTQRCSGAEVLCDGGSGPVSSVIPTPQMIEYAIRGANPASGLTTLFVGIPNDRQGQSMEISIFDVTGAKVRTLTQGAAAAGEREFSWDHRSDSGAQVARGVYFARLQLGNETRTHKIVVSTGR